jgi:hypothetical protein
MIHQHHKPFKKNKKKKEEKEKETDVHAPEPSD